MADEQDEKSHTLGGFELGASHEAGPGLGRLYEGLNQKTGRPALVLLPDNEMEWPFDETVRVTLSGRTHPSMLILEVEQAPASNPMPEVTTLCVMGSSAIKAVENNAQVQAHLERGALKRLRSGLQRALPPWSVATVAAVSIMAVLTLGAGLWLRFSRDVGLSSPTTPPRIFTSASEIDTSGFPYWNEPQVEGMSYPMPSQPFRNQVKPPCRTKADQVEINGGCWMELARRPPCVEDQAEHQGKCYMPMVKASREPSQSSRP